MFRLPVEGARWPWLPYVAPMLAFLLLNAAEDAAAKAAHDPRAYPILYAIKIGAVALIAVACRSTWRDLRRMPGPVGIVGAITLGLAVAAAWVGLDGLYPRLGILGVRSGYDPSGLPPAGRTAYLAIRFFGLVAVVPLIEELFWRSFLMRWLINPDFLEEPVGRVTLAGAAMTSVGFMLEHPEWLPALLTGFAWAGLLARTRSVSACVISHATANLALGLYVLRAGGEAWRFL